VISAVDLVDRVPQDGPEYGHAVPYAAGRTGQVHDERAARDAGEAARSS
jgi:hypothetical protein